MPGRLTVGQRPLKPSVLVQIQAGQPNLLTLLNMNKIAVIGIMGAGKSTLSKELSEKLHLPLYHLDKIYWKPGWIKISAEEGESIQREIVKNEKWIIDGNWTSSLDIRLEPADTVIFLDYPKWLCVYRIFKRGLFPSNKQSFDKQEGVKEKVDWPLVQRVLHFPREEIIKKINQNSEGKNVYIFKSPRATQSFVKSVAL